MWDVKLSDSQRDALRALVRAQEEIGSSLRGALEALDYARWDDLPEASLPWDRVTELARVQEIGEADVVWDLAAGMPAAAGRAASKPVRAQAKRRPARR